MSKSVLFPLTVVIGNWQYSQLPDNNENIKNLIQQGNGRTHKNPASVDLARRPRGRLDLDLKLPVESFAYGVANRPSTPMKAVVSRIV
jgi:hypothetical protein